MSGTITVGHPSGNRSDNEPGSVFTDRGGGGRHNEILGKNGIGMVEGRGDRPSCSLPLTVQGHRAHWLLRQTQICLILLTPRLQPQLTSQLGFLPCPEAGDDRESWWGGQQRGPGRTDEIGEGNDGKNPGWGE